MLGPILDYGWTCAHDDAREWEIPYTDKFPDTFMASAYTRYKDALVYTHGVLSSIMVCVYILFSLKNCVRL